MTKQLPEVRNDQRYERAWLLGFDWNPEIDEDERQNDHRFGCLGYFTGALRCYVNRAESLRIFKVYSEWTPMPETVVSILCSFIEHATST